MSENEPYYITIRCPYCKGRAFKRTTCSACSGTKRIKEHRPHPSHRMGKWRTEILAPCGTSRFYSVRKCGKCQQEEWRHAAGHFLHQLGFPCRGELEMIKIIGLWEGLRKRPYMYIGKKSIYGLQCFIDGIWCAENINKQKIIDFDWRDFEHWVFKKVRRKHVGRSYSLALSKCDDDDEKAFDLWMDWVDQYENKKKPKQ